MAEFSSKSQVVWQTLRSSLPAACVVLGLAWFRNGFCVDDGYIFARVARNLASGNGWAFNPAEPVNAFTSVLWPLLLVPAARAGELSMTAIGVAYALAALAIGVAVTKMWKGSLTGLGPWLAAACVACPALWNAVGMESALEAALVAWTVVAYAQNRAWVAGATLGLAVLARPDACLLALLLTLHSLLGRREIPWRMALVSLALVMPWVAYATVTFGTFIPATFHAKLAQSSIGWWREQPSFLVAAMLDGTWEIPAALLAVIGLALSLRRARRMPTAAALFVVYGLAHALTYAALRAPAGYVWYCVPLHLSLIMAGLWGLQELIATSVRSAVTKHLIERGALAFAISFLVVTVAGESDGYRLSGGYRQVAALIQARREPADEVAAAEIGYLGYYADCRVLDIHALIHPSEQRLVAHGDSRWWLARQPRFVVTHLPPWAGEPETSDDELFARHYRVAHRVDSSDGIAILLWERSTTSVTPM